MNAFRDFLKANLIEANGVATNGKLIIEVSDSQIKGWYINKKNKEKLKQINYQIKVNKSR
jgi:hypothetical protein